MTRKRSHGEKSISDTCGCEKRPRLLHVSHPRSNCATHRLKDAPPHSRMPRSGWNVARYVPRGDHAAYLVSVQRCEPSPQRDCKLHRAPPRP